MDSNLSTLFYKKVYSSLGSHGSMKTIVPVLVEALYNFFNKIFTWYVSEKMHSSHNCSDRLSAVVEVVVVGSAVDVQWTPPRPHSCHDSV